MTIAVQEIQSQEFLSEYINGVNFDQDLTNTTPNLTGEVAENNKCIYKIRVGWSSISTSSNLITVEYIDDYNVKFTRNTGSFTNDGFANGESCVWRFEILGIGNASVEFDITSLGTNYMYANLTSSFLPEDNLNDIVVETIEIRGFSRLTGLIYRYNLLENNDNTTFNSFVTSNDIAFYTGDIPTNGSWATLIPKSIYNDNVTGSIRVRYLSTDANYVQTYEIENTFLIPYFREGDQDDINNNILPEYLQGENSLKYVFEADFRTIYTDENTSKKIISDNLSGDVGGYNEVFSGFTNNYTVNTVSYEDAITAGNLDGIQMSGTTLIKINASKDIGSFIASDKIGFYISYLPTQNEYQNTLTTQKTNFLYDNSFSLCDGSPVVGTGIIKSTSAVLNAGDIDVEIEVEYDISQQMRLSDTSEYIISLQLGDITKGAISSDRSNNLVDLRGYDSSPDIADLFGVNLFRHYTHDLDIEEDGYTDNTGWNESGIATRFNIWLDLSKDAVLNDLKYVIMAYNDITNSYFILDQYNYVLSYNQVIQGVQEMELATTRGYELLDDSQFNVVSFTTASLLGDKQYYHAQIGQKTPWEDWIFNNSVDNVFFDNTKPNNNLNFRPSNYNDLNDYKIYAALIAEVTGTGDLGQTGQTTYIHKSSECTIYDYLKDGNEPPEWIPTIKTYSTSTDADLDGAIMTDENTRFEIEYENQIAPPATANSFYAVNRIQPSGDSGKNIEQLSSIRSYPEGNKIIPLDGLSNLTLAVDGNNLVAKGIIDYTQLTPGVQYDLSGELRNPNVFNLIQLCFQTNNEFAVNGTFDPSITKSGAVGSWNLGDGSPVQNTNSVSYSGYIDNSIKDVCLTVDDAEQLTEIDFHNDEIYGSLDISMFDKITSIKLYGNPDLTSISNAVNNQVITAYYAFDCNLSVLDMSGLTELSFDVQLQGNPNLASITNPVSSQIFSQYTVNNCNLNSLNISMLTRLGGLFSAFSNPNMISISNPTSSQIFTSYRVNNCNLNSLNISTLSGLGGVFHAYSNPNLTSITNPTTSNIFISYFVFGCNLNVLDLSTLTGLGGDIQIQSNPNLMSIINPVSSQVVIVYKIESCNLNVLDLSGMTSLGGVFSAKLNPNLASITNPVSSQIFSQYTVNNCNLNSLNISTLSGLGGVISMQNNSNLTSISNPVSSQLITGYYISNCNLNTLNISGLTGLSFDVQLQGNPNLTNVINPPSLNTFIAYYANSCNITYIDFTVMPNMTNRNGCGIRLHDNLMTSGNVDQTFIDLDNITSSGYGTARSFNLGGTNAAPTAASAAARSSLIGKGVVLTHN